MSEIHQKKPEVKVESCDFMAEGFSHAAHFSAKVFVAVGKFELSWTKETKVFYFLNATFIFQPKAYSQSPASEFQRVQSSGRYLTRGRP